MLENSSQIIDALRIRLGVETDAAVATALGVRNSAVGHWRAGRSAMSPELAMKCAALLGVEPGPLVLVCLAETEQRRPPIAALFRSLAQRLGHGARRGRRAAATLAAVAVGAVLGGAPVPSQAASVDARALYIMANRRRPGPGLAPA